MPSPVGHALGGLIVGLALGGWHLRPSQRRPSPPGTSVPAGKLRPTLRCPARDLTICALVACLPDLDFLWGRHNMETHSLSFAALVGVAVFAWSRRGTEPGAPGTSAWRSSARLGLACTLAVASHVLFDWLGSDDTPPLGVMALWPFTNDFYFADAFVFEAISRRYWLPGFVQHNGLAVLREIAILAPVAGAFWMWRRPKSGL